MRPTIASLRTMLAIAIAYYAFGRLGQLVAIPPNNVTFLWLPAGIALAALYRMGPRYWPGVWLGALVVDSWVFLAPEGLARTLLIGGVMATGATLQAVLGASLLRRSGGIFQDVGSVFRFIGPLAFGTCLVSATLGTTVLCAAGQLPWQAYPFLWLTWWLGDIVGVIVATPFLLAWWAEGMSLKHWGRVVLDFLPLVIASALVFLNDRLIPIAFLPLPLVVWLSFKYRLRGAVSAVVLVYGFALAGSLRGVGPFAGRGVQEALLLFVTYVVVLTLSALVVAVVEGLRRAASRGYLETLVTLEDVIQTIPDFFFIIDLDGELLRWNRSFSEASGFSDAELAHKPVLSFYSDADRPVVAAAIAEVYTKGYTSLQATVVKKDGSPLPIDFVAAPLRDAKGEVIGLISLGRDYRERKRMAERLRESEHRFRTMALRVPVGIFLTDAAGFCVFVNERWSYLTGLSEAQALGTGWANALHPLDRARVFAEWEAAVAARREFSSEYRFLRPDGSIVWVYGNATPLDPSAEEATGYIGTVTDLTERIEAERLKLNFVNAVSHDLRTPLASIMGFAEFLEDEIEGPLNAPQREYLAQIQRGAKRLEQLVDDLLDFATIEAGSFRMNVAPEDFGALLTEIASSFRPQADEGGLTLELDLPAEPLMVPMDRRRIERVVMNLVQNAIKFSPRGGRITLRASIADQTLRCEVGDRGRGIPASALPKLFKPFSQLEDGNVKGGAGLGLSISKAIVEAHRGTIGVLSALGSGSTFWFTLPVVAEPAPSFERLAGPGASPRYTAWDPPDGR